MIDRSAFSPWEQLGIASTTNREAIRRAYAARLKEIDLAKDRAAFERLRSAYEATLHGTPVEIVSRPPPSDVELDTEERHTIAEISALITAGRMAEAFALFERADSAERLSLGAVNSLDELFLIQTAIATVPARELLLALVRRFGWDDVAHPRRKIASALFAALDHRLAAEAWYSELLKRVDVPNGFWPPPAVLVAKLLLRSRPRWRETLGLADWRLMLGGPLRQLRADLKQLDQHWAHVGGRFDAERVRWCRRRSFPGRITLIYILVVGMVAPLDMLLGGPTGPGRINLPLFAAVAICIALWLTHRVGPER
jgi:hypothetical protein